MCKANCCFMRNMKMLISKIYFLFTLTMRVWPLMISALVFFFFFFQTSRWQF